MKLIMQRL
jgi:hypothetical protein